MTFEKFKAKCSHLKKSGDCALLRREVENYICVNDDTECLKQNCKLFPKVNPDAAMGRMLAYLERGGRFTKVEGWSRFGILNVGGRVSNLRDKGYDIKFTWVLRNGKKVARYYLLRRYL